MKISERTFTWDTEVVSEKQFDEHLTLYKGAVAKSNEIYNDLTHNPELRKFANDVYSEYRGLKVSEPFALNAIILHELYFGNMKKNGGAPGPCFTKLCDTFFGSFDNWHADFVACAKAARGFSIALWEQRSGTLRNIALDTHDLGVVAAAYPLLALDMYEHAYFLDYGIDAGAYIKRFMDGICWETVEERARAVS